MKPIENRNYLNATNACPAFSVVNGLWDCWRMEPVRFIGMGHANGAPAYRYVSLLPCTCNDGVRGDTFYTYAPLPAWGEGDINEIF